jgi:hypothetical protein
MAKEVSVSPRGLFGFFRTVGLMALYVIGAGEKPPPRPVVYRCQCGRKYEEPVEVVACKARQHSD